MNKILLITTTGCLGCTIMKRSIEEAIAKSKVDIAFKVENQEDVAKKFLKLNKIVDFPTVIFYKDENFLFKKTGSVPTVVVTQWIKIHFE